MISIQVSIVQVGNSKGIRLSKTLLDKYQIKDQTIQIETKPEF